VHKFSYYVYFFSLRVSGDYVLIIWRNNCICATLGTCYSEWMTIWYAGWNGVSFYPAYQSSIQNIKYQVSHEFKCFSWCWARSRQKHVEKRNKHTKKNCAPIWLYFIKVTIQFKYITHRTSTRVWSYPVYRIVSFPALQVDTTGWGQMYQLLPRKPMLYNLSNWQQC